MSTQPTLKDLGVTVHPSVIGNPANGYVKWEDSKEYVLGHGAPLLSPAGSMHSAVYSLLRLLAGLGRERPCTRLIA